MSTLLGTTLSGRYRLDERIGSGGMSTVFKAADEKLERFVAIKVMNQEVATDSEQLERFRREARAVARLSHVNVVGVIDAGEDAGHPYIVFEYVQGETLKERIRRLGALPIPEAVAYAIEIARALSAAHQHHIVHRDVKPQNVLIDGESGVAKVTDFGIARTLEEEGLTSDGRVIGTTDYVSPEQAMGHGVSGQSDLYSLGIVLYEMLTGELPFKAQGQVAVAMKHVRQRMPDVRALRPEVSATLAAIVDRATAKHTIDRYSDDQELIRDLEEVLALETSRAGQATGQAGSVLASLPANTRARVPLAIRKRRGTIVSLGLLAVLVAAAIVLLVIRGAGGPAAKPRPITTATKIALRSVTVYNPYALDHQYAQHNGEAGNAIDGNPHSAWDTEQYYGVGLGKPGVGLYVTPDKPTSAQALTLVTGTAGYNVVIYATNTKPDGHNWSKSNWQPLGYHNVVHNDQSIPLDGANTRYAHYLVWIKTLPPGFNYAAINEITLRR